MSRWERCRVAPAPLSQPHLLLLPRPGYASLEQALGQRRGRMRRGQVQRVPGAGVLALLLLLHWALDAEAAVSDSSSPSLSLLCRGARVCVCPAAPLLFIYKRCNSNPATAL